MAIWPYGDMILLHLNTQNMEQKGLIDYLNYLLRSVILEQKTDVVSQSDVKDG